MNQCKFFKEGTDFYYDKNGFIVLTASFLLKRGNCCGSGCRHCPYNYENMPESDRKAALQRQQKKDI